MPRNQKKNAARLRAYQEGKAEVKQYSHRIERAFSRLSEDCSNRVIRATSLEFPRDYTPEIEVEHKQSRKYYADSNPFGNKIHAVQKMKLSSKPLI